MEKPSKLIPHDYKSADDRDEMIKSFGEKGTPMVIVGMNLTGRGRKEKVECFFQSCNLEDPKGADIRGWSRIGDPDNSTLFSYFDSRVNYPEIYPLPEDMILCVAEVDPSLVEESASQDELKEIIDFITKTALPKS